MPIKEDLITYLAAEILSEDDYVTSEKLQEAGIDQKVVDEFVTRSRKTIKEQVDTLFKYPLLNPEIRSGNLADKLRDMLFDHIVFPKDVIKEVLEKVYGKTINSWSQEVIDETGLKTIIARTFKLRERLLKDDSRTKE